MCEIYTKNEFLVKWWKNKHFPLKQLKQMHRFTCYDEYFIYKKRMIFETKNLKMRYPSIQSTVWKKSIMAWGKAKPALWKGLYGQAKEIIEHVKQRIRTLFFMPYFTAFRNMLPDDCAYFFFNRKPLFDTYLESSSMSL